MARISPPPPSASAALGVVRWLLPLALGITAAVIEWAEHLANSDEPIGIAFFGEVFLFAIAGPAVVAVTLTWVVRILDGYRATGDALEQSNRSLEASVAERTRHLEAATAQLESANDELRQLDRMKSEFVSLVSHQLRAPLTNITGALELVVDDADSLPPASRRTLRILQSEIERMAHLIRSILDVSRIEAGRLVPRLGAVAVEPLLGRTIGTIAAANPEHLIRASVPTSVAPAWADELLLEEVIRNLLENAVRYSPAGSAVDVAAVVDAERLAISVTDRGPGIPVEAQAKVFRSFDRLGDAESQTPGYGLGLYFAERLMEAQGGSISLESPAWHDGGAPGARFSVSIPVAPDEPPDTVAEGPDT